MASKKAPVEQKIVDVSKIKKETVSSATVDTASTLSPGKGRATGFRVPAILLWLIGIAAMVFAILGWLDGNTTMFYICLAVAAVCCLVGSLLWKHANRIRPCPFKDDGSIKNKILVFLWNQAGLVAAFITFMPIILFVILAGKNIPKRVKNIAIAIVALLAVLVATVSVDYNPPIDGIPREDQVDPSTYTLPEGAPPLPDGVTLDMAGYYTQFGNSYHIDSGCSTIRRSLTIYSGTVADAIDAGRVDPCDICAHGGSSVPVAA